MLKDKILLINKIKLKKEKTFRVKRAPENMKIINYFVSSVRLQVVFQVYKFCTEGVTYLNMNTYFIDSNIKQDKTTLRYLIAKIQRKKSRCYLYACTLVWIKFNFLLSMHCPSTVSQRDISPLSEEVTIWWQSVPGEALAIHLDSRINF